VDNAWIGAIIALGGVVVGTIGEAWRSRAAFRREKGWTVMEERRRRLEELYQALDDVGEIYSLEYIEKVTILNLQAPSSTRELRKIPWAKLRMLVALYHPELLVFLQKVEMAGGDLGSTIGDAIMKYTIDVAKNQMSLIPPMAAAMGKLNSAVEEMKASIVAASRKLSVTAEKNTDTAFSNKEVR